MHKKTLFAMFLLSGLMLAGNSFAGTKFINKDTAKERKTIRYGTSTSNKSGITIKSDKNANTMSSIPKKDDKEENMSVGPIFVVPEIKP
ncbi:hypothetical protein [Maridesulfovibrio hydrothermalis]|uniref:Uncharacterized protein n=1 Tax=Maridesulfovibrio hydrothermalis AM13 = DSM 14728 TaxID=1121451 RepID=L0RC08_9BACT|nr:hypothetical protein [Maridesulfovibrio hydrothermalis]CCO23757.1 conserved exported protein of unknown function [Maridesulfovibrio hydrothermalis AM13 = DSM 14728]